jgi:hypothetical protein
VDADTQFLHDRLETIASGLKEAVRREVRRLREQGLPVYVAENGKVVARNAASTDDSPPE